ncbi:hypothetical protein TNIN_113041 [Trichonephila inaurata madagascariensis]|uniref:Uncharacterized protein n=1 Tax=Trichonephila inaurata madagascariensis TaxID=2747483 RepID=A0A8X6YH75_9ARAC|nr:hypothetical protein TNIN_113041 [Trichonephila inaurata madagascariensis]
MSLIDPSLNPRLTFTKPRYPFWEELFQPSKLPSSKEPLQVLIALFTLLLVLQTAKGDLDANEAIALPNRDLSLMGNIMKTGSHSHGIQFEKAFLEERSLENAFP